MALNLLNKFKLMRKHFNKIFNIVLIVVFSIIMGYSLRIYHEGKIKDIYKSQAERDLSTLEEEFYSALKKPRSFLIFNGMFKVYPMSKSERVFYYRKADDLRNDNLQITKNMEDNENQKGDIVSDVSSLNDSRNDKPQIIKNMKNNKNKQVDIISDILPLNEDGQVGIVRDDPPQNLK